MTRRDCPPTGVPAVTHATIARHHYALAVTYDRERFRLVLEAHATRNGRELRFAS